MEFRIKCERYNFYSNLLTSSQRNTFGTFKAPNVAYGSNVVLTVCGAIWAVYIFSPARKGLL